MTTSILWRRLDQPGHDSARLSEEPTGALIEGSAVFSQLGQPCRFDYRVVCDANWRTRVAQVGGWVGARNIDLVIAADDARRWTLNGASCPEVQGCDDVDLNFSPATNLLPIRRMGLAVGARAAVRAAWLRLPELTLEPLEQNYERLQVSRYRYESSAGAFVAILDTNAVGFVMRYPPLWELEAAS